MTCIIFLTCKTTLKHSGRQNSNMASKIPPVLGVHTLYILSHESMKMMEATPLIRLHFMAKVMEHSLPWLLHYIRLHFNRLKEKDLKKERLFSWYKEAPPWFLEEKAGNGSQLLGADDIQRLKVAKKSGTSVPQLQETEFCQTSGHRWEPDRHGDCSLGRHGAEERAWPANTDVLHGCRFQLINLWVNAI